MRLGIDVSTYLEELEHGAKYYDGDRQVQPLELFRTNGVDRMRIRLWVDPKSKDGKPYLAGNCDFDHFLRLARLASDKGYKIMLDLHYSDFWADPGKQTIPKSWEHSDLDKLVDQVYTYTARTLKKIRASGIKLEYVQVGNEITNGILWPLGKLTDLGNGRRANYGSFTALLKAGIRACRKYAPEASIVLHLEKSYDQKVYDECFTEMEKAGVDYDVIGYSYYPYWHGTFEMFYANVDFCKKFGKRQIVVEIGYAFTLEDYIKSEHGGARLVVSEENKDTLGFTQEYPLTPEGQKKFTEDFLRLAEQHGIEEVYWWEPLWIPGDGICWASKEGMEYIGEIKPSTRNEWANQCLFDYRGRKLPAFDAFRLAK